MRKRKFIICLCCCELSAMAIDGEDIKKLTIEIQLRFLESDAENLKWSLLKEYHFKYLSKNLECKSLNLELKTLTTSYATVLSVLLDSLSNNLFTEKWQEIAFDKMFLQGIYHEAFLILIERIKKCKNYSQKKIIDLLLKFLQGSLDSLLISQCVSKEDWDLKYVSKSNLWIDLITGLISLPERIANATGGKFINLFSPNFYVPLLLSSVFRCLYVIHSRLKNSQDCTLEFLAKLTGRLCIVGNANIVAEKFSGKLLKVAENDFIWRRISQNFIRKMPSNSLDSFIINLLLVIPWYGYVEWILGNEGVENEKIKYIMSVKLFFVHSCNQDIILQNSIGYFASSPDRLPHFSDIVNSLLYSWMDEQTLKHQNIEQKIYIASAIMICAGWIRKLKLNHNMKENINKVLKGTQLRLESSEEAVRSLGMIVGEHMIKSLEPDSPLLKFEPTNTDLLNHLKSLLEIPLKPDDDQISLVDLECFEGENSKSGSIFLQEQNVCDSDSNCELDSDDEDLHPYDMTNDIHKTEHKGPLYLRDCMKGLMEQENVEWTEQCLKHAEELIKSNPYAVQEVAEEMTKIVLHLNDNFAIPNFIVLRHRILISLTTHCPVIVTNYLTSKFCARDYNIRQRLDILEVLAASSIVLSHSNIPFSGILETCASQNDFVCKTEANWKAIISQRLEAKTKRYTKPHVLALKENKFSSLAGNFFYPLLNAYERASEILKFCGEDSYVLGRYVYTLAIIMYSAANTLHCKEMGTTFLQFLATLRSHKDVFVRQSVIFAVAATFMSIPCSILMTEMLSEVTDTSEWLQNVAINDPEKDCIEKALYTLSIFQNIATEGSLFCQQLQMLTLA